MPDQTAQPKAVVLPFVVPPKRYLIVLTPEEADRQVENMVKADEIRWDFR